MAGNQTARAGELLRDLALPVVEIASSAEWGVAKPSPEFFERVIDLARSAPDETLYVGDHPVNGAFPARATGELPPAACGRTAPTRPSARPGGIQEGG